MKNIKLLPTPPPLNLINVPVYFIKLLMQNRRTKYEKICFNQTDEYAIIVGKFEI